MLFIPLFPEPTLILVNSLDQIRQKHQHIAAATGTSRSQLRTNLHRFILVRPNELDFCITNGFDLCSKRFCLHGIIADRTPSADKFNLPRSNSGRHSEISTKFISIHDRTPVLSTRVIKA